MDNSTDNLFKSLRSKKSEDEKYKDVLGYLEEGANVNATDEKKKNNTPLHIAVQNSDLKIIELLLSKNADVTLKNDQHQNPLDVAKSLSEVDDDVVALLTDTYNQRNVISKVFQQNNSDENIDETLLNHEKRDGTASGISGQFYETKLLSLVLFRCLTDETVENFYLGTNVKDVGDLDDVCLKYKLKGESKPRMLFIQAKHREQRGSEKNNISIDDLKNSDDFKLTKYFDSYKKIREKFEKENDIMFQGAYEDVECDFVIFTPSENSIDKKYKKNSIDRNNHRFGKLFCTRDNLTNIFEVPQFDNINTTFQIKDEKLLLDQIVKNDIESLSEILKEHIFINNEQKYKNIMLADLVKTYHVVLAEKVFQVGEIIEDKSVKDPSMVERYRKGILRPDFFSTKDKLLILLREKMFKNIPKPQIQTYKSEDFKLPKSFGNLDLTLSDNIKHKKKRIDFLARTIIKLADDSEETKVIRIDDTIFGQNDESQKSKTDINIGFVDNEGGIAGLVGNLLLFDNVTKMYYFNECEDKLNDNSKLLLNELKKQFQIHFDQKEIDLAESDVAIRKRCDLYQFKFDVHIKGFPKLSFDCDDDEKTKAKDYLQKLWFLTNQCQQNELQSIVKMEMECQYKQANKNRLLPVKADAIFLKFHQKVQDWWMIKKKSLYQTSSCDFYKKAIKEILESPILTVLNLIINDNIRKNQAVKFKSEVVQLLEIQNFLNNSEINILNLYSTEGFLTILKLSQFFENNDNTTFIDFDYVLEHGYCEMMKSELQTTELDTFVFFKKKQENIEQLCKILADLVTTLKKKIVIVTQTGIGHILKLQFNVECLSQSDEKCDLNDVFDNDALSQNWTIIFQGQEVKFDRVIEGDSKRLVNSHILAKLIKNETIEIGKPLANKRYDEVKQYCIPRNLTRGEEHLLKTFKDINENVVLIEAEPGMGKSVLMNQLAFETKEYEQNCSEPSSWIVFINLRDYSSEFKMWKENNVHITLNEVIRFICKTAVDKLGINNEQKGKVIKGQRNDLNAFKVTVERENIHLKSFIKDSHVSFELQLFIDYFKKGNIIFIFDGFDEICPQYERQVSSLLRELTRSYHLSECELMNPNPMSIVQNAMSLFQQKPSMTCNCPLMGVNQQRVWVTTRSYNNIKNALETELGRKSFTLKPLSKEEQTKYLMGYFEIHFNIPDLTEEDVIELNHFLNYMLNILSDESKHIAMVSVPLYAVYATAIQYFQNKFTDGTFGNLNDNIKCLKDKCGSAHSVLTSYGPVFERQKNIREQTAISENPLHLYMAVEYFCSQIKEHIIQDQDIMESKTTVTTQKWDIKINSFDLFEKFLEIKFWKIRFEEKNDVDTSRSDNERTLKNEKDMFVDKHKKMALCAIFDRKDLKQLLTENLLDETDNIMTEINSGEEKTGIIVTVIDKVPRFVHLVFAEYFAIEYISDLLRKASKSEIEHPSLEELWRFTINVVLYKSTGGVRTFFDHKLRNDTDFINLISSEQSKKIVFESLIKQGRENQVTPEGFNSSFTMLRTSLNIAVEESLHAIQEYIFDCIESSVNAENVDEFTEIISNSLLVFSALGTNNDDLIHKLQACVSELSDNSTEMLIKMMIPSFAKQVIPFGLNPESFRATWNMLSGMIPQLANINIEGFTMTPTLRHAIIDYIRLLWDLTTNVYRF